MNFVGTIFVAVVVLASLIAVDAKIPCGSGSGTCEDGQVCCSMGDQFGCCPIGGYCCNDLSHCCPWSSTCNIHTGECTPIKAGINAHPLVKLVPVRKWITATMEDGSPKPVVMVTTTNAIKIVINSPFLRYFIFSDHYKPQIQFVFMSAVHHSQTNIWYIVRQPKYRTQPNRYILKANTDKLIWLTSSTTTYETMITIYSNVSQDSPSVKGLIGSNKIVDTALKASIVSRKSENVENTTVVSAAVNWAIYSIQCVGSRQYKHGKATQ